MMNKLKQTRTFPWPILLVTILALIIRVYRVNQIPPALSWDEVSIGYNAYSILKTGFDEHQKFLPLDAFAAFGDYKPPLAIYLTVPSIAIFGLNEFGVRFPSILFGTLTVLMMYFLTKELFEKNFKFKISNFKLPIIAAALLTISPWHWQLSRAGFEANIALFLLVLGVWLILKARHNSKFLLICWLPMVATIYTFNSSRYFAPFLSLILLIYCWKQFKLQKKYLISGMVIAALAFLPILPHLFSAESRLRFKEVNIFTDDSVVRIANDRINATGNNFFSRLIHNRRWGYLRSYLIHYLDHFETRFLFLKGDGNPKFSLQDTGQLYLVELPFLLFGTYYLARRGSKLFWLFLLWLVGAIAPAAVARETPHALRIENSLPVWIMLIALGISSLRKKIIIYLTSLIFIFSVAYFWHNYFNHYQGEYSGEWQYGYREAILYLQPIKNKYTNIFVSENIGRPYIYVAFYEKMDPRIFWQEVKGSFDIAGFYNVNQLGKYRFIRSNEDRYVKNSLYVVPLQETPYDAKILKKINLLNGQNILTIYENP